MSPSNWLIAILEHPSHQANIRQTGTAHETINDMALSTDACLRNLTQEKDPVLIFPSKVSKKVITIHNVLDLGNNRINKDPIPFAVMGFGTFAIPVTFDHHELLKTTATFQTPKVPAGIEALLGLDSIQKLKAHNEPVIEVNDSEEQKEEQKDDDGWTLKRSRLAYLLPPTLIETMANLPNADPERAFLACRSRIHDLVHPPTEDDAGDGGFVILDTLPAHDIAEYESLLQFLFALTKGNIPGSELEPRQDDMFQSTLHDLAKLRLDTEEPLRPNPQATSITPAGAVDFTGLQNAVDRLASTSSTKKPGWDRLSTNKKQMILNLCSTDESNPALHPTHDFRELLQQRNSAEATDHLVSHLQDSYGVDADLSGMLSASLYTAKLSWDRRDTPSNFTGFLMARMTGHDQADIDSEKTLATSLKHLSGAPLTDIEAQKATKAKQKRPQNPDEAMYMLRNMHRICCMLFGKNASLCLKLKQVVDHIRDNHLTYSSISDSDPNFPTKIVYHVDLSCQNLFRSALSESNCNDVDWASIDFGYFLRQVNMRCFNIYLPKCLLQTKRPKAEEPGGRGGGGGGEGRKKPKLGDDKPPAKDRNQKDKRHDLARNSQNITNARLQPGEQWGDIFPKGRIPPECPKYNGTDTRCCGKFHSGGACNKGAACERSASHGDLDKTTIDLYCSFIKTCRIQAKKA